MIFLEQHTNWKRKKSACYQFVLFLTPIFLDYSEYTTSFFLQNLLCLTQLVLWETSLKKIFSHLQQSKKYPLVILLHRFSLQLKNAHGKYIGFCAQVEIRSSNETFSVLWGAFRYSWNKLPVRNFWCKLSISCKLLYKVLHQRKFAWSKK